MVNPSRCWFGLLHSSSNRIRAKCTGSWGKITPNETGRFHTALNNVKSADATLQNFTPDLQKITHICDILQLCIAITVTNGHDHPRITDTKTNLNLSLYRGAAAYLCTCIWRRFGGWVWGGTIGSSGILPIFLVAEEQQLGRPTTPPAGKTDWLI